MAAIVHRCTCRHLDKFHTDVPTNDGIRPCLVPGCACTDADPQAPEVIPTWSAVSPTAQAELDPVVIEPGTVDGPGLGQLCDCEDCQALYDTYDAAGQVA
ncbi:hypothetical protein ACIA5G_06100 [Amycolatopsis sp. NPDC051758]|uniref:hypothetical protein n=1 Tax=Amycolatopsis sp. NPDC051758 TaxID=3363935 RepID=UPI0037A172B4